MSWTRLDDGWTDRPILEQLPYEVRWHYLALVQFCSRTGRYDGLVRAADARRCSDVPDPITANDTLVNVGLLHVAEDGTFRLPLIDEHIPPPHLREENARPRSAASTAAWRRRKCERGDHSKDCPRGTCPVKLVRSAGRDDGSSVSVIASVTSHVGTGRDGTGKPGLEEKKLGARESRDDSGNVCELCARPSSFSLIRGRCRRCLDVVGRAS